MCTHRAHLSGVLLIQRAHLPHLSGVLLIQRALLPHLSGVHSQGDLAVQVGLGDHVGAAGVHHPGRLQGLHEAPSDRLQAVPPGHLLQRDQIPIVQLILPSLVHYAMTTVL